MGGLLVQFLGLFALLGLAALGYRHWISNRQVGIQGKGMLLLSVVTLVGGLLGSIGWWIDDPRSFSWDLPPLASRMLASAGWAFGVATLAALHRPVPRRTRLVMLMLAVYLAPLLVTAPLFPPRPLRPCCAHYVRILRAGSYHDRCRAMVSVQATRYRS